MTQIPPGPAPWTVFSVLAAASAQEIEQTKLVYLGAAFAVTWIAIAAYLFWIFRRQRRLEAALEKIQVQDNGEPPKLAPDNKSQRSRP